MAGTIPTIEISESTISLEEIKPSIEVVCPNEEIVLDIGEAPPLQLEVKPDAVLALAIEGSAVICLQPLEARPQIVTQETCLFLEIPEVCPVPVEVGIPGIPGPKGDKGDQGDPGGTIAVTKYRFDQNLVGAKNEVNLAYTLPGGDLARNTDPGFRVLVYVNGDRWRQGDEFSVSESGGAGTGFDTVTLIGACVLISTDEIAADYVLL